MNRYLLLFFSFILVASVSSQRLQAQYKYEWQMGSEALGLSQLFSPTGAAVDAQGNVFVTNEHNIQKFSSDGKFLFKFGTKGSEDGQFQSPNGIALDQQGNIFVADQENHRIQKFSPSGEFLSKFGSYGVENWQFNLPTEIALDQQGNLYVIDDNHSRIRKFSSTGQLLGWLSSWGQNDGQYEYATGITVDSQGNIFVADSYKYCIQKFSSTGQFLAKIGSYGPGDGQFYSIFGITVDLLGNIYAGDESKHCIQIFSPSGAFIAKIGGLSYPSRATGLFQFFLSTGIAVDKQGGIYVTDCINHRIQKFSSNRQFLWQAGAPLANEQLHAPSYVAVDSQGNIFVADSYKYCIQKFSSTGQFLMKFGGFGTSDGKFNFPTSIVIDPYGNIFVADFSNNRIQKFSSTGQFLSKFGSRGGGDGQFDGPQGLALDKQGNIYVTEQNNARVQKFSSTGQFLMKFGGFGTSDGKLNSPSGINIDEQGNIYVVDNGNNRIQKFSSTGQFLSKFGSRGSGDGQFSFSSNTISLNGIVIEKDENIIISDRNNNRIQKFSSDGKFLYTVGTKGSEDGQFQSPAGIALDQQGNIFVADQANHRIQKFSKQSLPNLIKGKFFEDTNNDCVENFNERPISETLVIAEPGPYFAYTDINGNYSLAVDTGTYIIRQVIPQSKHQVIQQICPANQSHYTTIFKSYSNVVQDLNFANKIIACPQLSASITSERRRRCFQNSTKVTYRNTGLAIASGVRVHVKFPQYVLPLKSNISWTLGKDSIYTFEIGNLTPNQAGALSILDSVVCGNSSIRGLTQCTKVWITSTTNCGTENPPSPDWDKSDITLKARCADNGLVKLSIYNTGTGHMADSSSFRIYLDAIQVFQHQFKLQAGDSLSLQVPANGQTVRLEADLRPFHPTKTQSNISIEACGVNSVGSVSTGFVAQLPQDDEEPEVAIECLPIIDSFDPNDKLVLPAGVTENHYTPTNKALDYTIRFQNTGSDYAYKVVVVDTLSEHLDMSTFQVGAASHAYKLNISGKGRPILTFTFDNINLPDSTRDQLGSNGFIKFSIKPLTTIAEKTVIENFADIFFDFNEPVRTNTVFNSIYDMPATPVNNEKVIICQANAVVFAGANRSFCGQDTLYLQANTPAAGKGKWKLIKGTATIQTPTNPKSLVTNLGYGETVFEWKLPVNTCSFDSTSSTVAIHRKPVPGIPVITQKGTDSLFCNISAASYEWYREGIKLAETSQYIKVSENGNYTVKVSLDGCSSPLSEAFSYQKIPTGLEEYGAQLKVYPNPATSSVFIELPANWQATVMLSDAMGRAVKESILTKGEQRVELSLAGVKSGMYILHITTKDGAIVRKLIVR